MQIAVARATHATMSTERANDRLITVHAPFLAIVPTQNATLQFVLCTIDPQCEDDCCRLYGFVFLEKKRKRNIGNSQNVSDYGRSGIFSGL